MSTFQLSYMSELALQGCMWSAFVMAFKKLHFNAKYNHARMLEQLKAYAHTLEDHSIAEDYERALERIFNRYVREQDRVRFV